MLSAVVADSSADVDPRAELVLLELTERPDWTGKARETPLPRSQFSQLEPEASWNQGLVRRAAN